MNKKGQVVLFVIIALVLAAAIGLFFLVERMPTITTKEIFNPAQYIEQCTKEFVNEATDKMLPQGGFLEPKNYKSYNRTDIEFICKSEEYYKPCVNLHPMLIDEIAREIKRDIEPKVGQCFDSMVEAAKSKNQEIDMQNAMTLNVSLAPGKVFVNIDRKMTIKQGEETKTFENFEVDVMNPAYDLANVALEIGNQEAKDCFFDDMAYLLVYNDVDIRKFTASNSTSIYSIIDKKSGITMNVAVRGCVLKL